MTGTEPAVPTCPVVGHVMSPPPVPVGTLFDRMDGYQDLSRPAVRTEEAGGYWVFTDQETILDGLQQPDLWSSAVIVPIEPNPQYKWIPIMLDPPEHTQWRHLLGSYFSPGRTKAMKDDQHRLAAELIEDMHPRGRGDFVREFARIFPSTIFLQVMGMPRSKLDDFLSWEHMILHQDSESDPDGAIRMAGMQAVQTYFAGLVAQRRANPDPDARDVVSAAVSWEIDGRPVSDGDVLNCLLLLFMAGLDTVASQSSYALYHLATHREDRKRIVAEPGLIPHAVEELMRAYPIVQTARKATRDADFHGCPVKAGDMAAFPLSAAGRDESVYADARHVDLDRTVTRHLGFGGGPHRCLGSHLARQELVVLLEEWHRLIPDYEVVEQPAERGGGVWGLESLKLRWAV
ncbi:cytochrome P450 [Pseudonocardia kunmingensis]|uniref:Cytochrome P450 n=1 Tax=Pseudonocardia kunmingensis TaxID=630975 RepID=A0A543DPS5_9PSEU|nr:cytochrome P450 [Pseudonocardia kunmingensis]TQM11319.1 cytochrome P450 [Pseudonocardia kunmingensis]